MLLTDELIDELHAFRIGMMARSNKALTTVIPNAIGKSIGGGYANFAGDGSPLTQVYGLGHRESTFDLSDLDAFFDGLATNWEFIVTPFASPSLMPAAVKLGYVPDHFETVLAQITPPTVVQEQRGIQVEEVTGDKTEWLQATASGWSGQAELPEELDEFSRTMAVYPAKRYLARVDGEPAGTASMVCFEGKYLFAGGCTRPQFRNRGIQRMLTQRRLVDAGPGSFVQVVALPGSQSHRNLQRVGFQPLYSKLVFYRHPVAS